MPAKPSNAIKTYYETLNDIQIRGANNEGATRIAFQNLLTDWGRNYKLVLLAEQTIEGTNKRPVRPDGIMADDQQLWRGYWEAKDSKDDLDIEINKKIKAGYPLTNMLFEDTRRGVLFQEGQRCFEADLRNPVELRKLLDLFVEHSPAQIKEYHRAVARFIQEIPNLAKSMTLLIDEAKTNNLKFRAALENFLLLCRTALNPDTSPEQVEDMLKQHILTERIFRSIFQNPDFVKRNAVAVELEKMVDALTSRSFSRDAFLGRLNYFYESIENTARTITDYNEKQAILNKLYEQFFQAYSTRAADTHGIVYTPPEIVRWMVASVQKALENEFGLELASPGVHIIDPCVGTGTFIMELLRQIPSSSLEDKYRTELHANEVMLLPYYIASQNIEHAFLERMNYYEPFPGICFADTLNIMDNKQLEMFAPLNSERVEIQKQAPIRVVIGNPPYNAWQENENDNNKNRTYKSKDRNIDTIDSKVSKTYVKASSATNKNALSDPYVKFFRWATDRLAGRDGIVCYVSNNSFFKKNTFDGMRKHLLQDFSRIYHFDFKGDARTSGERRRAEAGNIFNDQIRVSVGITLLIKNSSHTDHKVFYHPVGDYWNAEKKRDYLNSFNSYQDINWQLLSPDNRNNWLNEGMNIDFDSFLPMGTKEAKAGSILGAETIFKLYSRGVTSCRDDWVYDFNYDSLKNKICSFIDTYNGEVDRWKRSGEPSNIDNFVLYDDKLIKWSRDLKSDLRRKRYARFDEAKIRRSLYRPFTIKYHFFDGILNQDIVLQPKFFPTPETERENEVICLSGIGSSKTFHALVCNVIPDLHLTGDTQSFPFYVYNEDGTGRRENITDWALQQYRTQYADDSISKRDIFHYVYAVLHSPDYRTAYAENLKRDLPRIPFVATAGTFRAYVEAGAKLAELHRNYESVTPYTLKRVETPDMPLNWKVDSKGMRLSPDRTSLRYNDWLTLANIPAKVFDYKLGNRSALEWVIDQYRVSTDVRSGLHHDPNNPEEPRAIVRLIEQVVRVSLDTQQIITDLPPLA